MKMKRHAGFRRIMAVLLLALCIPVSSARWNLRAETGVLIEDEEVVTYYEPTEEFVYKGDIGLMKWNGKEVYCIEPKIPESKETYTSTEKLEEYTELEPEVRNRINAIAHFGGAYHNDDPLYYAAAQVLIFEKLTGTEFGVSPDLTEEKKEINRLVDDYIAQCEVKISATLEADGSRVNNGASLKAGSVMVIHIDTENLKDLVIEADDMLEVLDQNLETQNVRVKVKGTGQGKIIFRKLHPDQIEGICWIIEHEGAQTLMTTGALFGCRAVLNLSGSGYPAEILKCDAAGNPLKGAELQLRSSTKVLDTWISDGKAHSIEGLVPGETYTIEELKVPKGYIIPQPDRFVMPDNPEGGVFRYTMKNAQVSVIKEDKETGGKAAGDASLAKAEFSVYEDANRNQKLEDNEEKAIDAWCQDDPSIPHIIPYLKEGKSYILRETKAPQGYARAEDLAFQVKSGSVDQIIAIRDEVVHGSYLITKFVNSQQDIEADRRMEKGAGFTAILKRFADEDGDGTVRPEEFEAAYQSLQKDPSLLRRDEWAHGTSDAGGNLRLRDLAYGTYALKQTEKTDNEAEILRDVLSFEIKGKSDGKGNLSDQEEIHKYIRDDLMHYHLKVVKKDGITGKTITRDSAHFHIFFDGNGNGKKDEAESQAERNLDTGISLAHGMVVFRVGERDYDTFATASDTGQSADVWVSEDAEAGSMTLPAALPSGSYILEECRAPAGYEKAADLPVSLHYAEAETHKDTGTFTLNTMRKEVEDVPLTGTLRLHKKVREHADSSLVLDPEIDYTKIQFCLQAAEDILNPADGSMLVKAGQPAKVLQNGSYETCYDNGVFSLQEDGSAEISGLPEGAYELVERETDPVLIRARKPVPVTIKADSETGKIADVDQYVENTMTSAVFRKRNACGKDVPGARLTLYELASEDPLEIRKDENGKETIVDAWTTDGSDHRISGLSRNHAYLLKETGTPDGYVKAQDILVKLKDTETEQVIEMTDEQILISKQDMGGMELPGAALSIVDAESGETVERWISTDQPHAVSNLKLDGSYVLKEDLAPAGYAVAASFPFTLKDGKISRLITMRDPAVKAVKQDQEGKPVYGAELNVTDEAGNTVDAWKSGRQILTLKEEEANQLKSGKTIQKQDQEGNAVMVRPVLTSSLEVPEVMTSFQESENACRLESGTQTSSILQEGQSYVYQAVIQKQDGTMEYHEVDLEGYETAHLIQNLQAGKSYVLNESTAPKGYRKAESIPFRLEENVSADLVLTLIDQKDSTKVLPNTSDQTNLLVDAAGLCSALIVLLCAILIRRLQNQNV